MTEKTNYNKIIILRKKEEKKRIGVGVSNCSLVVVVVA